MGKMDGKTVWGGGCGCVTCRDKVVTVVKKGKKGK